VLIIVFCVTAYPYDTAERDDSEDLDADGDADADADESESEEEEEVINDPALTQKILTISRKKVLLRTWTKEI